MEILIIIASILLITLVGKWFDAVSGFAMCPVCMGVSGTWLIVSAGVVLGFLSWETWHLLIILLMGGSVVGIAFQGETRLRFAAQHPLLWKTLVIAPGMGLAYVAVMNLGLVVLVLEVAILAVIVYTYFLRPRISAKDKDGRLRQGIERRLKSCC